MSTLNNSDIMVSNRTRDMKNKFKKNKGVKHTKAIKFEVQEHWKRAFNIRYQKQSRKDNFVGEDDEEEYPVVATKTKTEDDDYERVVVFTQNPWGGRQEKIEVYKYDADRCIPGHEWTYGALTKDTLMLGTNGSSNIMTAVIDIENVLRHHQISFHFENNGAFWECQSDDHLFFLRLWLVDDDMLVLEPIVGIGEPDTFMDYYYNTLFVPYWNIL